MQGEQGAGPPEIGDPSQCVSPLSREDVLRLRRFADRVEEISNTPFGRPPSEPIELRGRMEGGTMQTLEFAGPDRHARQHVAGIFRELYTHGEPSSGVQIAQLIGRHAAERRTPEGDRLAHDMQLFAKAVARRLEHDRRLGILGEDIGPPESPDQMTPQQVIRLILYGELLHYDADKAAILAEDPARTTMMRVMFLSTARDLVQIWRNLVTWTVLPILRAQEDG